MMISISLRFIPTLFDEANKIKMAQMARGADFESGNIFDRAMSMIPLLVPLFINALKRSGDLATAMEARLYRIGEERTKLNEIYMHRTDWIFYYWFYNLLCYHNCFILPMIKNVLVNLCFDGRDFKGYQYQIDQRTVEEELKKAIQEVTGEDNRIIACGRTDAGVHARSFYVNFLTASKCKSKRLLPIISNHIFRMIFWPYLQKK